MSLQPQDRYATAKQLAADLNNWMHDDELLARPDRWYQRFARMSRRHRAVTAGALISAAFLFVGAVWMDRARNLAEQDRLLQRGLDMSLDKFEELCRPLANGEMNNIAVLHPISRSIADYTNTYLAEFEPKMSMKPLTGRVYELKAIISWLDSADTTKALADYDKAEQIYRNERPGTASAIDIPRRIAQIHLSRGELYLQRREYDRAHETLNAAAQSFQDLLKNDSENPILLRELAEVFHRQGEAYLTEENIPKSLEFLEKSRDLREKLEAKADPDTLDACKRDVARSHGYLGDVYLQKGQLNNAINSYRVSRERRKALFEAHENDPEHRFQYARGIANFGFYESSYGGNLEQAIQDLRTASELQKGLCLQFPEISKFRLDLGHSLSALAEVYLFRSLTSASDSNADEALCKDCLAEARDTYSDYYNQTKNTQMAEQGVNGLAACNVIEAALQKRKDPGNSPAAAYNAETMLMERHTLKTLAGDELLTLALAKALQNDNRAAINLLNQAVDSGENRLFRIESHKESAFKTLVNDPQYRRDFEAICAKMKSRLDSE
jgi:tetratricopeptide (TPR) repeat protein